MFCFEKGIIKVYSLCSFYKLRFNSHALIKKEDTSTSEVIYLLS